MKRKYYIILLIFICNIVFSQNYLPLNPNNQWVYKVVYSGNSSAYDSFKVIGDTIMANGKQYSVFDKSVFNFGRYFRVDSQYIYSYMNEDVPLFKLNGKVGDVLWPDYQHEKTTIKKIDSLIIFGKKVKTISYLLELWTIRTVTIAENFGFINCSYYDDPPAPWPAETFTLQGCTIDQLEFGIKVKVEKPSNLVKEFRLDQNYPNPFNPVTTIKYQIPNLDRVNLRVYDILGKEAALLVNEEKTPGIYEIKFDGRNLSSGIYFYKLSAGAYSQTRKLILIK